jgi:putative transposase
MSEIRKANTDATYFITLSVVGWIDVFTRRDYADELIKNLQYCQRHKDLVVFAYVIMPSHLHLVCRREKGLLSELLRDFKSYTAKQILQAIQDNPQESRKEWMLYLFKYYANIRAQHAVYMFWQKTNHPVEVSSPAMVEQKIHYIHMNPVTAGMVHEPQEYVFSSANPFSPLRVVPY